MFNIYVIYIAMIIWLFAIIFSPKKRSKNAKIKSSKQKKNTEVSIFKQIKLKHFFRHDNPRRHDYANNKSGIDFCINTYYYLSNLQNVFPYE